jgi:hypothetical protein
MNGTQAKVIDFSSLKRKLTIVIIHKLIQKYNGVFIAIKIVSIIFTPLKRKYV